MLGRIKGWFKKRNTEEDANPIVQYVRMRGRMEYISSAIGEYVFRGELTVEEVLEWNDAVGAYEDLISKYQTQYEVVVFLLREHLERMEQLYHKHTSRIAI